MPPKDPFNNKIETSEDHARNLANGQAIIAKAKARAEKKKEEEEQKIAQVTSNLLLDLPIDGKIATKRARAMNEQKHKDAFRERLRKAAQAD